METNGLWYLIHAANFTGGFVCSPHYRSSHEVLKREYSNECALDLCDFASIQRVLGLNDDESCVTAVKRYINETVVVGDQRAVSVASTQSAHLHFSGQSKSGNVFPSS